mmetsp:Transcript_33349/g.37929  ORF Transcript_33349/g.37929 Transcript_33349/m.37929 type:complete len:390 (-) Transcript_33349:100-1269(-)
MAQRDKVKHKRRYCRVEGCSKIVKSQGLCQRHGAKTRLCKIEGCTKQAQGNFDGMCKLHFKITRTQLIAKPVKPEDISSEPVGESVYDRILPESIGWSNPKVPMPLILHLKDGFDRMKPRGWHRNEERRARGLPPVNKPAVQLEGWERELVWMEICLLSGNPESSFRALARAWGRDKGFHMVLAQFICERRGNVERKKRVKSQGEVTKKQRRAPVEMAPSGEELPNVLELDDVELDMLGVLEGESCGDLQSPSDLDDPTINFTNVPTFANLGGKRGGKRRPPMELAPMHYSINVPPQPHVQHVQHPPNIQHANMQHINMQRAAAVPPDMVSYNPHHPIRHLHPISIPLPMAASRMAVMPVKALACEVMSVEETLPQKPNASSYDSTIHV